MEEEVCVFSKNGRCSELKEIPLSKNMDLTKGRPKVCDGIDKECDHAEYDD